MVELHSDKKQVVVEVELHLSSKVVFQQNHDAFFGVKRVENTHFLSHLQA